MDRWSIMDVTKDDIDSTSLSEAFSFTRERERAMHGLKGILAGVVADKRLNQMELLFLDTWLKSQQYLAEDQAVLDILKQVGDILEDELVSPHELSLMRTRIENIVTSKAEQSQPGIGQVEELVGFLSGIASDGVLNDAEVEAMTSWLDRNESIKGVWPANVVAERLSTVLEDGIITEEERQDLLMTVNQVTGANPEEDVAYQASTEVWEDKVDSIDFQGKTFCLTGDFVIGDRDSVDTMLHLRGAETSPNMNRTVDYLLIGTLANDDWLYRSHGGKLEKAILLKREGSTIKVITERALLRFIY